MFMTTIQVSDHWFVWFTVHAALKNKQKTSENFLGKKIKRKMQ